MIAVGNVEIPGYKIEKLIAEGGMASVYLARQESLNRLVALKLLRKFDNPSQAQRFFNEGRIIASLEHRNIITIYDVGAIGERHYLAMEYLQGGDLKARIETGMTPSEVLDLLETLGLCLSFVHKQGIIHRDIKPENILFRQDGSAVLTDFGVAKQMETDSSLTMDGIALGSPYYLSPEQAQCKTLDGRADIYSLGIVCYEMLTGSKPFQGDSPLETIIAHLNSVPAQLPAHLQHCQPLLARMIAVNPDDRFASAEELVKFVRRLRNTQPKERLPKAVKPENKPLQSRTTALPRQELSHSWFPAIPDILIVAGMFLLFLIMLAVVFFWQPETNNIVERYAKSPVTVTTKPIAAPPATSKPAPQTDNSLAIAVPPPESRISTMPSAEPKPEQALTPISQLSSADQESLRQADAILKERNLTVPRLQQAYDLYQPILKKNPQHPGALHGTSTIANKFIELQVETQGYLDKAATAIKNDRLGPPQPKNAADYFRLILLIEPGRKEALEGLDQLAELYAERIETLLNKAETAEAKRELAIGLSIQAEHPRLKALAKKLGVLPQSNASASPSP